MATIRSANSTIIDKFMDDPRANKKRASHRTFVHIAAIVLRGKIIAEATNKIGSRSSGCGYSDYTIHAERNVIKQLGDLSKLRGADLYVLRQHRSDPKFLNSKPCPDCTIFLEKCMREYGLKNVYYTT